MSLKEHDTENETKKNYDEEAVKKLDTTIEAILPVHRYLTATYSRFKALKNKTCFSQQLQCAFCNS